MAKRSIAPSFFIASAIVAALIITGCFDVIGGGGGGGPGRVTISGMVTSVDGDTGDVFGISVEAKDPINGKKLGNSTETSVFGAYQLKVPAKGLQRLIELVFTTPLPFSEAFSEFFLITKDSEVFLDVRLESPGQVIIDDVDGGGYQVDQNRIRIGGGKRFIFSGPEFSITTPQLADFTINGRSSDCIKANKNSSIVINVQNFSATNCAIGINANKRAIISIDASRSFDISSRNSGVRSSNQTFTNLSSGEEFVISSSEDFGIRAGGQSSVVVDLLVPPVDCEIFGPRGDINQESASAIISVPPGCLVP
ncbi:MAG: hypothetical protein WBD99_10420 [Thermodesulfobacteriota bacterium]